MNRASGNQHLQFTAEIWTPELNPPLPAKEEIVQIVTNEKISFLDIKISWSPEGDLQFGVFSKKGQQLKYIGNESNHTPGTLRTIPAGFLNRLAKLSSRKPSIYSEGVDKVYPDHVNALRKAVLAPPNFLTMGYLWSKQDERADI